jgi:hypothetical protein
MIKKNFMDDNAVNQAYNLWMNNPNLFTGNYYDKERFYSFVISCVIHVKYKYPFVNKQEAWKNIDMDVFKQKLSDDLCKKKITNWEEILYDILIKFETFIEYEKIRYSFGLK